jgi:hypothetical protein
MAGTQNGKNQSISLSKHQLVTIANVIMVIISLLAAYHVITPQQQLQLNAATESMIQQLMPDLNLTYQQVVNGLTQQVGSGLSGLAGPYGYLVCHPLGDTTITGMKNGTTGIWDYWNANFSQVADYALANATNSSVVIGSGFYTQTAYLLVPNNTELEGQSRDSVYLQMQAGINWTNIVAGPVWNYSAPDWTNDHASNVTIKDLTVDGSYPTNAHVGTTGLPNESNSTGVSIRDGRNCLVQNVRVLNEPWNGIQVYARNYKSTDIRVLDNDIHNCGFLDIEVSCGGADNYTTGIHGAQVNDNHCDGVLKIEYFTYDSTVDGNYAGGIMMHEGSNNVASGNTIMFLNATNVSWGFVVQQTNSSSFTGNTINGTFSGNTGLWLTAGSTNDTVTGNTVTGVNKLVIDSTCSNLTLTGNVLPAAPTIAGTGLRFSSNIGFTTEYYGSAVNVTATTWTFTPAMGAGGSSAPSPTYVWASFNSTQVSGYKWSYTGTTLTVTCVNGGGTADQIVACQVHAVYNPWF